MSCKYLDLCIRNSKLCPFLKRGKSVKNCGFFGIVEAIEKAKEHYTVEDKILIEQLMERLRSSWKKKQL